VLAGLANLAGVKDHDRIDSSTMGRGRANGWAPLHRRPAGPGAGARAWVPKAVVGAGAAPIASADHILATYPGLRCVSPRAICRCSGRPQFRLGV
jgi:hypothetical protein